MISILMPLHNGMEFLQESVGSIISQTYQDWELLIGINGLPWSHARKLFGIISKLNDSRISAMFFSSKGKIKSLKKLAACAESDVICLLDVDDYWYPEKLEKQLPFIEKYDVVGSDAMYFGEKEGYPGIFLGQLSVPMFTYQNPVINSAVMMKKECAQWQEEWEGLDDYNLWAHLLTQQKTFYNVPEVLIKHRIHQASYFNNKNNEAVVKLKNEKLLQVPGDQLAMLGEILDRKDWKL